MLISKYFLVFILSLQYLAICNGSTLPKEENSDRKIQCGDPNYKGGFIFIFRDFSF